MRANNGTVELARGLRKQPWTHQSVWIDEATKFIDLDRLCLSPHCGFASVPARAGRGFPAERKLARVVEVVEQASAARLRTSSALKTNLYL